MAADPILSGATVVFDLDGTLIDSAPDLVATLNHLLTGEGLAPLPLAQARPMIGQGARALITRGFAAADRSLSDERRERLFEAFIAHYSGRIAQESRPFPGAVAALDTLAAAGARLAVCTNKRTGLAKALLRALDLEHRFAAIVGADAAPAPKPAAAHLLTSLELAGGEAVRAVMVGDSAADAGAARAAGVPLVLVSFGYTDVAVESLGADILIDDFEALPDACRRLLAGAQGETAAGAA